MNEIEEAVKQFKERLLIKDYKEQIPEYYKSIELAIEALEKQIAQEEFNKWLKSNGLTLEEVFARNVMAWETSKDKTEGLLPEVYLTDRVIFEKLTGLEPTWPNLKKYIND